MPSKCPNCGYENPDAALYCNLCQAVFKPTQVPYSKLAEESAAKFAQWQLRLDFSYASLAALDLLLNQTHGPDGFAPAEESWTPDPGQSSLILMVGCYLGETLRRLFGGRWEDDPKQPGNAAGARVSFGGDVCAFPMRRAYLRFKDGSKEPLEALFIHSMDKLLPGRPELTALLKVEPWLEQGGDFLKAGRPEEALVLFERAVALDQGSEAARRGRDECRARLAGFAAEAALFEKTLWSSLRLLSDYYSPPSLAALDLLIAEAPGRGEDPEFKRQAACYLGETLRRNLGGDWRTDGTLTLGDGRTVRPIEHLDGKAVELFESLRTGPTPVPEAPGWAKQGDACLFAHREDLAEAYWEKALRIDPDCPGIWLSKGYRSAKAHRWEEALICFEKDLASGPTPEAWTAKGDALKELGRLEEAGSSLEQALALQPGCEGALRALAPLRLAQGRCEDALSLCERFLALNPNVGRVLVCKADALAGLGRDEEARACYAAGLEKDGMLLDAWLRRAALEEKLGRPWEAVQCCRELLKRRAGDAQAEALQRRLDKSALRWLQEGDERAQAKSAQEAVDCFGKALELDPSLSEAWKLRGVGLAVLGRLDESLVCFERALALSPDRSDLWDAKATSLARAWRFKDATAAFERALELDAGNAHAWKNRGFALIRLGRLDEGAACLAKALELKPAYAEALQLKAGLERMLGSGAEEARKRLSSEAAAKGEEFANAGKLSLALAAFQTAAEADPRNPTARMDMGHALGDLGRHEESLAAYSAALALAPDNHELRYHQGLALETLGRRDEAAGAFQAYLAFELYPREAQVQDARAKLSAWGVPGLDLRACGAFDAALALLCRSIPEAMGKPRPDSAAGWTAAGRLAEGAGRKDIAALCFEEARRPPPVR
ncbi:MAG TPA: hypothetical protein DCM05_14435 [Elusimicrobia bacterium]|nr:hypothetical protein [Elusimicrobiota bacterium]